MPENTDRAQYAALGDHVGRTAAPKRYTAGGRETFDRQRDLSRAIARDFSKARFWLPSGFVRLLGDIIFAAHCQMTAMKYSDRDGLKPGTRDTDKHDVYMDMMRHVLDGDPDPRAERPDPDFVPYSEVLYVE